MKPTITLLFACLMFASCGKTKRCWECTSTSNTVNVATGKTTYTTSHTSKQCDMNKQQIKDYEKNMTHTSTINSGLDNIVNTMDCKSKL